MLPLPCFSPAFLVFWRFAAGECGPEVLVGSQPAVARRIAIKAVDLVTAEPDTIVRLQREIQVRG